MKKLVPYLFALLVLIGEFSPLQYVPELKLQYKGGSDKVLVFFDPSATSGDGLLYVPIRAGTNKGILHRNGNVYEFTYGKTSDIIVNRR